MRVGEVGIVCVDEWCGRCFYMFALVRTHVFFNYLIQWNNLLEYGIYLLDNKYNQKIMLLSLILIQSIHYHYITHGCHTFI